MPFDAGGLHNEIFKSPYGILRDLFRERGIDLQTYDQGEIGTAEKILFFNHHADVLARCEQSRVDREKLALFLFEPEVVFPRQYARSTWQHYGRVFTHRDDILEKENSFNKFRYPQGQHYLPILPGFAERKFLTLINSNWYSYHPHELYSLRRKAIRYFEHAYPDFDLYGHGWNNKNIFRLQYALQALRRGRPLQYCVDVAQGLRSYRSYRGSVPDKYSTMSQYRFAICFENETHSKGYITEKIFDCFFSGTVPVYLGADNIEEYIPSTCYVRMSDYKNFATLGAALRQMPEEKFRAYQQAGQDFIHSTAFEEWRPRSIFQKIVDILG